MKLPDDFHLAIIVDGNGRWATKQGKKRFEGHEKGANTLKKIIENCPDHGVRYLTVYAFSSENWKRDPLEIIKIISLFTQYLEEETHSMHEKGIRFRMIGHRDSLPLILQEKIQYAETVTKNNTRLGLQIAFNYGGRADLLYAMQELARKAVNGILTPEMITEAHISQSLSTYPLPDPHLMIRTGGEQRISNYLLWQMSYTEFFFLEKQWPDFTVEDMKHSLDVFQQRERRFGGCALTF